MNITLTIFSDSPRHLEAKEAADTLKKVVLPVVAIAFASIVFPVPGGPNSNTPFHDLLIPYNMICVEYHKDRRHKKR
jgi:hypothetical protein